ncbi:hypothetical protein BH24ACT24_BH24ACT24_09330 [soil metagenome]
MNRRRRDPPHAERLAHPPGAVELDDQIESSWRVAGDIAEQADAWAAHDCADQQLITEDDRSLARLRVDD